MFKVMHAVPGFTDRHIARMCQPVDHLSALVVNLYGTGNAPGKERFLGALGTLIDAGTVVIATSRCSRGMVDLASYATGRRLLDLGVLNARDMTMEATTTKLGYLLGRGLDKETVALAMTSNLRGELTDEAAMAELHLNKKLDDGLKGVWGKL
jgi:L-asparaginase